MRIRDVYLANGQTLADADTVTIDLTRSLKILYLRIQISATNGATSNTLCKLNSSVSKVQAIDGSTVLQSLSMREAMAINAFDYGRLPYQNLSENDADTIVEEALLDFRRMPGDVAWYLDTSRYQNPQLQITYSLPISATAGFATGTGTLTVVARVIDSGAPTNLGFRMAKEIDSFASAASGDHTTDLPLDFPIAAILALDPQDGQTPDYTLSNFKLTADTDAFIPINMSILDMLKQNEREYGLFDQTMYYLEDTSATLYLDLYDHVRATNSVNNATAKAMVTAIAGNQLTVSMTTGGATGQSVQARGAAPMSAVIHKFGDGVSPDQIFSPQGVGKFQLKLTNANTGGTPKVVIVQQHG